MEGKEELDSPLKAFQACLQAFMVSVNQRIDSFIVEMNTKVTELKVSLEYTQTDVDALKQNMALKESCDEHISSIEKKLNKQADTIDYLENQSRRCNLRIDGLKETRNETWEETEALFRQMLTEKLEIPTETVAKIDMERVHRTGQQPNATDSTRPRQIVAKFTHFKDREAILKKARDIKPRNIYVNEDFSSRVVERKSSCYHKCNS